MRKKYIVEIGKQYGDLECIGMTKKREKSGSTATYYTMRCLVCGRTKEMLAPTIWAGKGTSHKACGEGLKLSDGTFYSRWQAMRTRTTNPNYRCADCYSGRGINSDKFRYFIDFYDTMYESYCKAKEKYGEDNVSLERVDVNGNYCKENCIWIPKDKQQANTRKTIYFEVTFPDGHKEIQSDFLGFAKKHRLNPQTARDALIGRLRQCKGFEFKRLEASSVTTIENEEGLRE